MLKRTAQWLFSMAAGGISTAVTMLAACIERGVPGKRFVFLFCIFSVFGVIGCQARQTKILPANSNTANQEKTNSDKFNVVVLLVHGLYEMPVHVRPKALGGSGEACLDFDELLVHGLIVKDIPQLLPDPSVPYSSDTLGWLRVASQGTSVCALIGSAADPGVAAGADWWVGQAQNPGGLPQRDRESPTGYASYFPVRRLGMTMAVAHPMTRPWLLQIGDEIADFVLFQERAAQPFAVVVELNVSSTQLQIPDENTLRLWRTNHSPADASALARLDMATSVITSIQSTLVWFHEIQRTMWIIVLDDGLAGTPPFIALNWPGTISPGSISLPETNVHTLQQILSKLIAGTPIEKGALPPALAQELNQGTRRKFNAVEDTP